MKSLLGCLLALFLIAVVPVTMGVIICSRPLSTEEDAAQDTVVAGRLHSNVGLRIINSFKTAKWSIERVQDEIEGNTAQYRLSSGNVSITGSSAGFIDHCTVKLNSSVVEYITDLLTLADISEIQVEFRYRMQGHRAAERETRSRRVLEMIRLNE